jgi:hypothetical protein
MRKITSAASTAAILLAAAGLTVGLTLLRQSASFSILGHGLVLNGRLLPPFLILGVAIFFGLALGIQLWAHAGAGTGGKDLEEERFRRGAVACLPFAALLAAPALLRDYLTRDDFKTRFWLLVIFALIAAVYLAWAGRTSSPSVAPPGAGRRRTKPGLPGRLTALPLRRRLLVLGLAAFLLYAGAAVILVDRGAAFSGDEPNYLINAHSLLYDRDVNLANNYASDDHFHFYSRKADPRVKMGVYAREGKKGRGHVYPINLPGVSVLMVPFYAAAQAFGDSPARTVILRGSLIVWAVLLGLQIYLLALQLWKREGTALALWAVYAFSTPVLFYAVHLYPEVPIALFSVYIYRMVRSGRALRPAHLAFMGLLLGSFFWFGLKYNMIFWPLLAVAVFDLWKTQRPRAKILWLVGPALAGLALFYFGVWTMYGTISPFAVYEGAISGEQARATTQAFLDLPHAARVDAFLDYFLDQRDGLFLYAPFWIFALLGCVEMIRRARGELLRLLLIAGPFVLNYAFFTHRQGACPQARVLTPVSWVGAIAVGYFLAHAGNRFFRWLFGLAAGAGGAISGLLLAHPAFLSQPTTHGYTSRAGDLFVHLGSLRIFWPPFLPSFIKVDNSGYAPNYVWVGLLALFVAAYAAWSGRALKRLPFGFHAAAAALLLAGAAALWVAAPRPSLYPSLPVDFAAGGRLGFYPAQAGSGVIAKPDGSLYLHFAKSYRLYFASREELDSVELTYGSPKGSHRISMSLFDVPLTADRTDRESKTLIFRPTASYRRGDLFLYLLNVSLEHVSTESMLDAPFRIGIRPLRPQPRTMARISAGESTR